MSVNFRIPKLSDRELMSALLEISDAFEPKRSSSIIMVAPYVGELMLPKGGGDSEIEKLVKVDSRVASAFYIRMSSGHNALVVSRDSGGVTDNVTVPDEWPRSEFEAVQVQLENYARITSKARETLKADGLEAILQGSNDTSWGRYKSVQMSILSSLQKASETLLVKAAENNAEIDKVRNERFEKLEDDLRQQLQNEKDAFSKEVEGKLAEFSERSDYLDAREAAFNTKEARYVARAKQEEQIDQVKNWLKDWQLTQGTTKKRLPTAFGYVCAILATGILTAVAVHHNYQVVSNADDAIKLFWWQWIALTMSAFFPLAACTAFIVSFIRWTSAWARQHAEEEFRNRALLIDIGRSAWLLEAVRDAQERKSDIPNDLLKELSRNLFSFSASPDVDMHPSAISDVMLQGLSSLRVKSPDGSEVEATRGQKR